jgi:uncharacterized membrane protein
MRPTSEDGGLRDVEDYNGRVRSLAAPACVLMTFVWLALLLAAPVSALGVPASGLTYALGSLICHQRPERSFHVSAAQVPVCARCAGLYAGAAIGSVLAMVAGRRSNPSMYRWRTVLLAAAVPTAATWIAEAAGVAAPWNAVRAVAALPLGTAVAWVVVDAARGAR